MMKRRKNTKPPITPNTSDTRSRLSKAELSTIRGGATEELFGAYNFLRR